MVLILYHGTQEDQLASILKDGLRSPLYLTSVPEIAYWAATKGRGKPRSVVIEVALNKDELKYLEADRYMLDLPYFTWQEPPDRPVRKKDWVTSLESVGSVVYRGPPIPVKPDMVGRYSGKIVGRGGVPIVDEIRTPHPTFVRTYHEMKIPSVRPLVRRPVAVRAYRRRR